MPKLSVENPTVSDAYLTLLADRGIDYLFANSGTDFAPIIESFVKASKDGRKTPIPVTVPHENVAVCMAMGYYLVSGRPQAVMVHVSVGTGNTINGLLNASRGQVPILMTAGRTPLTESGVHGTRDIDIHWPQEMFDQGAMVREIVKWDYELRNGGQVENVVDRALNIAMTEPRGPVYLTMPREVLASEMADFSFEPAGRRNAAYPPGPDANAIDRVASLIAGAENPMIIAQSGGRDHAAVAALGALADRFAIPVIQYRPRYMSLPDSHPMHLGFEPSPLLEEADVVLVVDALVPWLPDETGPRKDAKIIHMAPDPLFGNLPMRTFPCDIAITTSGLAGLTALDAALTEHEKAAKSRIDRRRGALAERRAAQRAHLQSVLERARSQTPISPAWLTHCIGEIKGADAIVVNEARMPVPFMPIEQPGTYINAGHAGGLGWGLGTAIGAKMAAGDRMVIATEGDGAYMFSNPVPAHYVAYEQNAPILTVIYNNRRWGAVREAAVGLYPDGHVSQSNAPPLINFDPGLKLAKTVDVVDGHGEQVTEPDQVMPALERAVRAVTEDKRQALLDVVCA